MRTSQAVSICPILKQAINAIDESFEREKQSLEFEKDFQRRLALGGAAPKTKLERPSREQYLEDALGTPPKNDYEAASELYLARAEVIMRQPPIAHPNIENAYLWRHQVVPAANSLLECGWSTEAGAITSLLNGLPTETLDWNDPEVLDTQLAAIRERANLIREILHCCLHSLIDSQVITTQSEDNTRTGSRRSSKQLDNSFFKAIRKWHGFDPMTMTCSILTPITNQALADEMGISPGKSTADRLEKFFGGKYEVFCSDSQTLAAKIATLGDTGINANLANALAETKAKLSKTEAKVHKKIADRTLDEDFLE